MRKSDIEGEVNTFVVTSFLADHSLELQPNDSLLDMEVIDSAGVLELVSYLEERFGIKVEDDEMIPDNLESISNVARYVEKKLGCTV
jgi:acyl carrier protein